LTNEWIYSYNGILFSLKKGILLHGTTLMNLKDHGTLWNAAVLKGQKSRWLHLYVVSQVVKFKEKVEWTLSGAGGGGMWSYGLMST
jgi:hypothetical protein